MWRGYSPHPGTTLIAHMDIIDNYPTNVGSVKPEYNWPEQT